MSAHRLLPRYLLLLLLLKGNEERAQPSACILVRRTLDLPNIVKRKRVYAGPAGESGAPQTRLEPAE